MLCQTSPDVYKFAFHVYTPGNASQNLYVLLLFSGITFLPIAVHIYIYIYIMETKGDEHLHHLLCKICQKEFNSTQELSAHIDQVHRSRDSRAS
jgi:hypothetical protein